MLAATGADLAGLRDRALLLLGFAMMARGGDLATLGIADVRTMPRGPGGPCRDFQGRPRL